MPTNECTANGSVTLCGKCCGPKSVSLMQANNALQFKRKFDRRVCSQFSVKSCFSQTWKILTRLIASLCFFRLRGGRVAWVSGGSQVRQLQHVQRQRDGDGSCAAPPAVPPPQPDDHDAVQYDSDSSLCSCGFRHTDCQPYSNTPPRDWC